VVFCDPKFVIPVIFTTLEENLTGKKTKVTQFMKQIASYGGLAAEVSQGANTLLAMVEDPECKVFLIVQVGIRDLCEGEVERIKSDRRIIMFDDWQLKDNAYSGMNWATQCEKIIATLPELVYISFDIDGLAPEFCPNTGTPVPGGLDFNQAIYLLQKLVKAGKTIIGFDLCEVAPGDRGEWDGNVGARLLYKLANLMYLSRMQ